MREVLFLILMGVLAAQDLPQGRSQYPSPIKEFELNHYELPYLYRLSENSGEIMVEFTITETGNVEEPQIRDTFDIQLNDLIIHKVKQMKFSPPLQSGIPVSVRYKLPIVFKPM
tara:strand:- start:183 stop:524 length:342 start_codon:yes stop_codon:yes gene_type:complete